GAAWVFTRTAGTWGQQGKKLVGSGAVGQALQGVSVSMSSDGNTALIGGYADSGETGAAWVFTRSNGTWNQQGSKLVGAGAVGNARQGISVALSSDGNTAIVGGYIDDTLTGAAWVFTRTGGAWSQQGGKLVGSGAVRAGFGSYEGYSVSLSADGNTAIIGGYPDNGFTGAAWVFTRSGGVWTQLGSKFVGTGAAGNGEQGVSVSLSSDGNTALVGGFADNNFMGAAWAFTRTVSGVQSPGAGAPSQFSLGQNYPNPFNPTTAISYELPRASDVNIGIYDVLGRLVSTLVHERKEAGSYDVRFNGSNLSSGIYFYRMVAGDFAASRRFVLVK
ncbi:MAG TPA: T9SS type A sorting domain-containing protein, partial [Bacteroidota bacterium]|nr:T9SS type A sorting domain-containing protein [Bacteroidota bacterium]